MWGWQKVENVTTTKAKWDVVKVQTTIAMVQYMGSFILAFLNDLFLTHLVMNVWPS